MKKRFLALLLFAVPALSGEITLNCDSRVINEKSCVGLLKESLQSLGCMSTEPHCLLHPWGSDFVKSWICTAQSNPCSASLQAACPAGSSHAFNEQLDVCVKSETPLTSVQGVCRHEHAAHSVSVKTCDEVASTCAKFGGTAGKCAQPEGFSEWQVACEFPSLKMSVSGSSCPEIQSKCELINADKGVKGKLISCLPQYKKPLGKSAPAGPFDSN